MTYVFSCPSCGRRQEQNVREAPECDACVDAYPCGVHFMIRDYRAENVGVDRSSLK